MKNAKRIIVVDSKDTTAAITLGSLTQNGLEVSQAVIEASADGLPQQAFLMAAVAQGMAALLEEGFTGRVAIVVPEQVTIRCATALKARKAGGDAAAIYGKLYFPWMANGKDAEAWQQSLSAFAQVLADFEGTVLFVNARELYRWEVFSAETLDDETVAEICKDDVSFTAGVNADMGLTVGSLGPNGSVVPKTFYNERVTLVSSSYATRDGGKVWRLFAPRFVTVGGKHVPAGDAAKLSEAELEGVSDSQAALVDVIRLRAINVRALPLRGVSKIVMAQEPLKVEQG